MKSYIKLSFWILLWSGFLSPGYLSSQNKDELLQLKTVVIDAGHGGNDPGAISGGTREKDIVLAVALRLGNKIKSQFPDVKVIYTRSRDVFIPLYERASIAVRNKADVFISLHANYVSESSVRGTETFTLGLYRSQENLEVAKKENSVILLEDDYSTNYQGFNPNETESYIMFENMQSEYQTQSIDLAATIQNEFTHNLKLRNRGVKQAGFLVLRETTMPAVLIEIGFITNPEERKFLVSESGKEKVAGSVFRAFSDYKKSVDRKSKFNIIPLAGITPTEETIDIAAPVKEPAGNQTADVSPGPPVYEPQKTVSPSGTGQKESEKNISPGKNAPVSDKAITKSPGKQQETVKTGLNGETTNSVSTPVKETIRKDFVSPKESENSVWYSVQVGAALKNIEPSEKNFKGEKEIIRMKATPYFKYYMGRHKTAKGAFSERSRILKKFPDAFVVIVENGVSRPLKNSDLQ